MTARTRHLLATVGLTVMWIALWRELSAGFVLSGLALSAAIVIGTAARGTTIGATVRPVPATIYLGRFLRDLVVASAVVAWEVVTPRDRRRTAIVAVPIAGVSDVVTMIVANTLTLVPGTLTIETRRSPATLYVHVLHLRDPDELRAGVQRLERLAIRAFAPHPPPIREISP